MKNRGIFEGPGYWAIAFVALLGATSAMAIEDGSDPWGTKGQRVPGATYTLDAGRPVNGAMTNELMSGGSECSEDSDCDAVCDGQITNPYCTTMRATCVDVMDERVCSCLWFCAISGGRQHEPRESWCPEMTTLPDDVN